MAVRHDELMNVVAKPVTVLIVDDQEAFRSAARLVVELADGFAVVGEAPSGEDAIDMVHELRPDLVLMDIKMPGLDGIDATRRVVADHPGVNVIVLSTYEANEYEQLALDAGAIAFVSKSDFGPHSLEAVA